MKSIHRVATVFAVCSLSLACTEAEPARSHKQPKPAKEKVELAPTSMAKAERPELTSTAQSQPRSILDAPKAAPTPPAATPAEPAVQEAKLEQPSEAEGHDEELKLAPADVHIDRFVLATGVEQREPVGESETFSTEDDKIFAFVQFENEKGAPFGVRVHWEKVDGPASPYGYVMEVPTAKRWRTWSWTAIKRGPGRYRAVLRTLDGEEVASREFTIEAPEQEVELPLE